MQRKDTRRSKVVRSGWIPGSCKLAKQIRWPVGEMKPLLFDKSRIGLDGGFTEEMNGEKAVVDRSNSQIEL